MSNDLRHVAVATGLDQFAAAHLVVAKRLGAALDQAVGPHVVVGADHQAAEGVHEGIVPVAAVTGTEEVLDQTFQPLVTKPAIQVGEELFLFSWPHIVEVVVRAGPFEERIVLRLVVRAGVVEDDHPNGVAVAPEVFIILFDGLPHLAETMGGDYEKKVFGVHAVVAYLLEL